jgi:hypothetical protein
MNREQLVHAIRAACEISGDHELYIFGSQAILGQYPKATEQLRKSVEVDLSPKNKPEMVDQIDGALGEQSMFHQTHGFYVHGISLEAAALPEGWEKRTVKVKDYMNENRIGWCVEAHDLAASKLIAFREKDTAFVRKLLLENMIKSNILKNRIRAIEANSEFKNRALKWVKRTASELE